MKEIETAGSVTITRHELRRLLVWAEYGIGSAWSSPWSDTIEIITRLAKQYDVRDVGEPKFAKYLCVDYRRLRLVPPRFAQDDDDDEDKR